jgi:NADH:ubiquinone oxidoreductase subunit 2 (subunit N)
MVDLTGMGLLIALGLAVLLAAEVLVRRSRKALLLATLLAAGAAVVWLAWAGHEYRGLTYCPFDAQNRGHPVLVGLALSLVSAVLMISTRWKLDSRGWAAAFGLSAGVLAAVGILVVAFVFGAGLHCTD